jgi:Mg2+ and Co2+ transporter CorA
MFYSVQDNENSINETPISLTNIEMLETRLRNLQSWRRRSRGAADRVSGLSTIINSQKINCSNWEAWSSMADDCEHISQKIDAFSRQFDAMGAVVTSLVQIVDSRQSFTETANLSRLTYLALVFVPMTFVSSLFSMTGDFAPGRRFFWVYFVVAIPSLVLVFLIARPRQTGVAWMAEHLSKLTRGRRWQSGEEAAA